MSFLKWYQDPDAPTSNSPANIRDRWNASNPQAKIGWKVKGNDVVKAGLKAARKFLDDHNVELDQAIEQLEQLKKHGE